MIIAEAGINHNGSFDYAVKLARAAKNAGADAVKFQTFWNINRVKKYELSKEKWIQLKRRCEEIGIAFLSTPHTFEAIHFLDDLVPIHKIASTYLPNINFLKEVASKNKPILLSTGSLIHNSGVCTIEEIRNALSYIPNADITLLHCISKYPCSYIDWSMEEELANLGYPVGLSDHTKEIYYDRAYPVLEKHIMLDNMRCPDESVSLVPKEFKEMVECIKSL